MTGFCFNFYNFYSGSIRYLLIFTNVVLPFYKSIPSYIRKEEISHLSASDSPVSCTWLSCSGTTPGMKEGVSVSVRVSVRVMVSVRVSGRVKQKGKG